jgi:hypothetical protein
MDFVLKGSATVDINPVAIEIDTFFKDTNGNPIIPKEPITGLEYGVYVKTPGNYTETQGLNV